jgi:hypothetical protein
MQERQLTQAVSFKGRLSQVAARARAQAQTMSPGKDRDALMERARQAEMTAQLDHWLTSPGLKSSRCAAFRAKVITRAKRLPAAPRASCDCSKRCVSVQDGLQPVMSDRNGRAMRATLRRDPRIQLAGEGRDNAGTESAFRGTDMFLLTLAIVGY